MRNTLEAWLRSKNPWKRRPMLIIAIPYVLIKGTIDVIREEIIPEMPELWAEIKDIWNGKYVQ